MSRIVCITGWFKKIDKYGFSTGEKEFIVSHGINEDTLEMVVLPQIHPTYIGAKIDSNLNEYVLED